MTLFLNGFSVPRTNYWFNWLSPCLTRACTRSCMLAYLHDKHVYEDSSHSYYWQQTSVSKVCVQERHLSWTQILSYIFSYLYDTVSSVQWSLVTLKYPKVEQSLYSFQFYWRIPGIWPSIEPSVLCSNLLIVLSYSFHAAFSLAHSILQKFYCMTNCHKYQHVCGLIRSAEKSQAQFGSRRLVWPTCIPAKLTHHTVKHSYI